MNQPNGPGHGAATGSESVDYWDLRLYVTGRSPKSVRALDNLRNACDEYLAGRYRIEIVDLLENPRLAAEDQILAVPTVVRRLPRPIRRIVGDLSDLDPLLVGLQVRPRGSLA
jgi:circadian clock protein KaiB